MKEFENPLKMYLSIENGSANLNEKRLITNICGMTNKMKVNNMKTIFTKKRLAAIAIAVVIGLTFSCPGMISSYAGATGVTGTTDAGGNEQSASESFKTDNAGTNGNEGERVKANKGIDASSDRTSDNGSSDKSTSQKIKKAQKNSTGNSKGSNTNADKKMNASGEGASDQPAAKKNNAKDALKTAGNQADGNQTEGNQTDDDQRDGDQADDGSWALSLNIYDSEVDGGRTALTSVSWDGTQPVNDRGYSVDKGDTRTFTVQITYRNTQATKAFNKGELKIEIPDLSYEMSGAKCTAKITVGANDASHTNYDWDYKGSKDGIMTFTNAVPVEEESNFEGSIQIAYEITSDEEKSDSFEKYDDTCLKEFSKKLTAHLYTKQDNGSFASAQDSNDVKYHYQRTYIHPWIRLEYDLKKIAQKINSFDGLKENPDDYIWVKYYFSREQKTLVYWGEAFISATDQYVLDELLEGAVVYNADTLEKMQPVSGNTYKFKTHESVWQNNQHIYINNYIVGYPKKDFKEEDGYKTIVNTGHLYGTYQDRTEPEELAKADVTVKLADFLFSYPPGNLYGISKMIWERSQSSYKGKINYESLIGKDTRIGTGGKFNCYLRPYARYTGKTMDVKFGDDLLYITGSDGKYRRLKDEEYYFTRAKATFVNGNNISLAGKGYTCELWTRTAGSDSYTCRERFIYDQRSYSYSFKKEEAVVGYYFLIKDVNESVMTSSELYSQTGCSNQVVINNASDIKDTGRIYNFDFIQVTIDGKVVSTPDDSSYSSPITRAEIMAYDQKAFGMNVRRAFDYLDYVPYDVPPERYYINVSKKMDAPTQDGKNECFKGQAHIIEKVMTNNNNSDSIWHFNNYIYENYYKDQKELKGIKGFDFYDLLPKGMKTTSSEEDIFKTLKVYNNEASGDSSALNNVRKLDGTLLSEADFLEFTKSNTKVTITENYKGTGRTMIHVVCDYSADPLIMITNYYSQKLISFDYDYEIPYDSYLEYGGYWKNTQYLKYLGQIGQKDGGTYTLNGTKDDGNLDKDAADLDGNGNTEEELSRDYDNFNLTAVVSTFQDVTKYVQTRDRNYTPGLAPGTIGDEYSYKLRVRTGRNAITELVMYDSIENYIKDKDGNIVKADGGKPSWQGSLLDVDTSFAESQGYKVKVYWSDEEKPGALGVDESWKLYDQDTDKSSIKSLAFEYLDEEGKHAVIPESSLTYVIIKMKAPDNGYETARAYNGCWTFWRAIDDNMNPVDFITGINSNTVQLSLYAETRVNVEKKWLFDDEAERPDSIRITLLQNGKECRDMELKSDDDWKGVFDSLPAYDDNGKKYKYTIKEDKVSGYESKISGDQENGFVITNVPTISIPVKKVWDDSGDNDGKRPESITIELLSNDEKTGKTIVLDDDNGWKGSFDGIERFDGDGEEIEYSVSEQEVSGYRTLINNEGEDGFVITNTYDKPTTEEPKTSIDTPDGDDPGITKKDKKINQDEPQPPAKTDNEKPRTKKPKSAGAKDKAKPSKKNKSPYTGDDMNLFSLILILISSGAVLIRAGYKSYESRKYFK